MKAQLAALILLSSTGVAGATAYTTTDRGFDGYVTQAAEGTPALAPFEHVRFCLKLPAECSSNGQAGEVIVLDNGTRAELAAVNREVNASIAPERKSDSRRYQVGWSVQPAKGDCNDYAVSKRSELIARGYPSSALLLAVVETAGGEAHLVLLARTSRGDLVLDNLRNDIRTWSDTPYRWKERQSDTDPRYWVTVRPERRQLGSMVVARLRGTTLN